LMVCCEGFFLPVYPPCYPQSLRQSGIDKDADLGSAEERQREVL
jgi:hypothetical protein